MACLHDHSCEDHDCSSDWSLYKHIDLPKVLFLSLPFLFSVLIFLLLCLFTLLVIVGFAVYFINLLALSESAQLKISEKNSDPHKPLSWNSKSHAHFGLRFVIVKRNRLLKRRVTQIFVAVVCRWVLVYYGFGTLVVGLLCKEALLIFDWGDWYFAMLRTIVVCKWHMRSYFLIDLILLSLECLLSFGPLCTKMCHWEKAYFCF